MKRTMGITLIIIGIICLTLGITCLTHTPHICSSGESVQAINVPAQSINTEKADEEPIGEVHFDSTQTSVATESDITSSATHSQPTRSEEIGQAFENFMVNLLADSRFRLLDRTQDCKSTAGVYAESCKNPDLHIEQTYAPRSIDYYIECKYRSRWYEGKVQFEDYQVKRYKEFQAQQHRKVLFALGVGGTPAAPGQLLLVPLDRLNGESILETAHKQYQIAPTSDALFTYMEAYFKQIFAAAKKK